jgi:hypothetical protein
MKHLHTSSLFSVWIYIYYNLTDYICPEYHIICVDPHGSLYRPAWPGRDSKRKDSDMIGKVNKRGTIRAIYTYGRKSIVRDYHCRETKLSIKALLNIFGVFVAVNEVVFQKIINLNSGQMLVPTFCLESYMFVRQMLFPTLLYYITVFCPSPPPPHPT